MRRWPRQFYALLLLTLPACGGGDDAPALEREVFIATFVDLRAEAILSATAELTDEQRTIVLGEHGVTEEELLAFAEYYGNDTDYMKELWDEVEERLDALRPEIDEGGDLVRPIQRPTERIGQDGR